MQTLSLQVKLMILIFIAALFSFSLMTASSFEFTCSADTTENICEDISEETETEDEKKLLKSFTAEFFLTDLSQNSVTSVTLLHSLTIRQTHFKPPIFS